MNEQFPADTPTDAGSEADLVSSVGIGEWAPLAQQIAAENSLASAAASLNLGAPEPSQMVYQDVKAACNPKGCIDHVQMDDGTMMALIACGEGTCRACPNGLGNLVVRAWCAYANILDTSDQAMVLILVFGAQIGPIRV